jgi:hypothetical protein
MDERIEKGEPKIQADHQSIAIGEINITGTVTGNITIGHTIVQPADARLRYELGILLKNVQTVGDGYRFIHRLLLEHFAEMGETKKV